MSIQIIPARRGVAVTLEAGQRVRVINTHGQQVVDTWAFDAEDPEEFLSMEHTRGVLYKLCPTRGDTLYSNRRRPMLEIDEDTTPGAHDTLIAACDPERYRLLGCTERHDNCTENLADALRTVGIEKARTPCPLNLFMNIPVSGGGVLSSQPPLSKKGDYVTLRAKRRCHVVFSACPQDMVPINGVNCRPTDAHYEILPVAS
ncbi:MAG: DUF1989 domain-containing protein [Bradyrhizobium sp.]|uniref:DUF1989 domain-containing protein n=1 Tax=Bradyrhizobium sp. TaxID=376 RepID=UPI003D1341C5